MSLQILISKLLGTIIKPMFPILIGLGFVGFFWGLARYLFLMSGDSKNKSDAKQFMIWGVVTITVMISVWGIVQLLQGIFLNGSSITTPPTIPKFNTPSNNIPTPTPTPSECDDNPYQAGC